ncbi:MAG: STAS domain-containing protein, partial [Acidimicrobiales bacterium]
MVPKPFRMWAGEHGGVLVVRLAGYLGRPWSREVHRTLVRHCPSALVLEVSELADLDPSGLAALVAVRQDVVSGGGRFVLRGACG